LFNIDPSQANKWFRITAHISSTDFTLKVVDLDSDSLVYDKTTDLFRVIPEAKILFGDFRIHSTSHTVDLTKPEPHFWLRNTIISTTPIDPH